MTRHSRPVLRLDDHRQLDAARRTLRVIERDHPRTSFARDAAAARRAIDRIQNRDLGSLQTVAPRLTERLRAIAAAQPLTESELRLMHGDR